jgi:hypothetical protein
MSGIPGAECEDHHGFAAGVVSAGEGLLHGEWRSQALARPSRRSWCAGPRRCPALRAWLSLRTQDLTDFPVNAGCIL